MSSTYIEVIAITKWYDMNNVQTETETLRIKNEPHTDVLLSVKKELSLSGKKLVKIISLKIIPKCWGCQSDPPQPNQLAHMDVNGCLYVPSDEEQNENYNSEDVY